MLPVAAEARKAIPLVRGVLDYFPAALAEIARVSQAGNDQQADAIAMLPGWDAPGARGSVWEYCLATRWLGLPAYDAATPVPPPDRPDTLRLPL
jgi:hypothetical protein